MCSLYTRADIYVSTGRHNVQRPRKKSEISVLKPSTLYRCDKYTVILRTQSSKQCISLRPFALNRCVLLCASRMVLLEERHKNVLVLIFFKLQLFIMTCFCNDDLSDHANVCICRHCPLLLLAISLLSCIVRSLFLGNATNQIVLTQHRGTRHIRPSTSTPGSELLNHCSCYSLDCSRNGSAD